MVLVFIQILPTTVQALELAVRPSAKFVVMRFPWIKINWIVNIDSRSDSLLGHRLGLQSRFQWANQQPIHIAIRRLIRLAAYG